MVAFFSIAIVPLSSPLGPTNPIRSPRLTWSETSLKSARPAKDFESCETVSIAESAQCCLVRCPAQLPPRDQTSFYPRTDIFISAQQRPSRTRTEQADNPGTWQRGQAGLAP